MIVLVAVVLFAAGVAVGVGAMCILFVGGAYVPPGGPDA